MKILLSFLIIASSCWSMPKKVRFQEPFPQRKKDQDYFKRNITQSVTRIADGAHAIDNKFLQVFKILPEGTTYYWPSKQFVMGDQSCKTICCNNLMIKYTESGNSSFLTFCKVG